MKHELTNLFLVYCGTYCGKINFIEVIHLITMIKLSNREYRMAIKLEI